MEKAKGSNIFQMVLVALLIGAAFYIGSLSSKVERLEGDTKNTGGTAGNTETVKAKFDPVALAESLGIDKGKFKSCIDKGESVSKVKEEEASGQKFGISGTPGIIMLDTRTGKSVVIPGAVDSTTMQTFLDNLIAGQSTSLGTSTFDLKTIDGLKLEESDHVRGEKTAQVLVFEYSDYDCPFCKRVHPTLQKLLEDNSGKVGWIYRQMPLTQLHPEARVKSEAAVCAGMVGGSDAYWAYSDALLKE